ncbi:MAG TPA: glycosyltransferase family 2 protein [Polyangiales bacterium]|nr:glycosyltransferase family 2 protein [Polyangiales bacterium]
MKHELTLAIPYYSGFALFEQTLRSLAGQRVLVVDDSPRGLSRDELAIIARLVDARVLRNATNLGMARSWNRCLDEASTDLVTIVHADDLLAPGYAARVVELAEAFDAPAVFTGARVIGSSGSDVFSVPDLVKRALVPRHHGALELRGDAGLAALMRGNFIFCPSLCFRRSRMTLRFDPRWRFMLDMHLTVRLLLAGESLVGVPEEPLYLYRRHADNATARLTAELTRFREEHAFYREVTAEAAARGLTRAAEVAGRERMIQLNLAFCIARDLAGFRLRDGAEKARLFGDLFVRQRMS